MKILIVESRFHKNISDISLSGAREVLESKNIEYDVVSVHNIFEIPAAVNMKFELSDYSGVVALGCTVKDENLGQKYIYQECVRGLNEVGVYYAVPIGLGVFFAENTDKCNEIASKIAKDAAFSCLKLLKIREQLNFVGSSESLRYSN